MNRLVGFAAVALIVSGCGGAAELQLSESEMGMTEAELASRQTFSFPVEVSFPSMNPCNGNPITENLVGEVRGSFTQANGVFRLVSIYDVNTSFVDGDKTYNGEIYELYTELTNPKQTVTRLSSSSHVTAADGSTIDFTIHFISTFDGTNFKTVVDRVDLSCPQ